MRIRTVLLLSTLLGICISLSAQVPTSSQNYTQEVSPLVDDLSYTYDGTKLRVTHIPHNGSSTRTDYCGNITYENGTAIRAQFDGGYASLPDGNLHYYVKDHLGSNRLVVSSSGQIEERNDYYPYGGLFSGSSSLQPYKYNGKELDDRLGLSLYDYGARFFDSALGWWNSVDPLCYKGYEISPYSYTLRNPINRIDLWGLTDYILTPAGSIQRKSEIDNKPDRLIFRDTSITIKDKNLLPGLAKNKGGDFNRKRYYQTTNHLWDAILIFKFVTDRVQQEWKLDIYENGKGEKQAILATDRKPDRVSQTDAYVKDLNMRKIIDLHSHNDKDGTKGGSSHDMKNSKSGIKNAVYHTHEKKIYEYNRKQKNTNEKHIGTNYKLLYDYITQKIDLH